MAADSIRTSCMTEAAQATHQHGHGRVAQPAGDRGRHSGSRMPPRLVASSTAMGRPMSKATVGMVWVSTKTLIAR